MTLTQFLITIRRRWIYVLVPFVLSCLAVGFWSMLSTPAYTAKASTYFSLSYGGTPGDLYQGSNYTQQQIGSYALLTTKPVVLQPVIDELGLDTTVGALARDVNAKAAVESVIVDVTVTSTSAEDAARIANAVVQQLGDVVSELSPKVDGKPSVEATIVAKAEPPQFQSSPNTRLNVLIAAVAGLMVGVFAALAREHFDNRVRTKNDLPESTAVLATIQQDSETGRAPAGGGNRRPLAAQPAYRTLRTNLSFLEVDSRIRQLVVTSSMPGEGTTTVALNLSAAIAEDGHAVIVVDADLRRPKVAEYLGLEGGLGLADVLAGRASLQEAVQPCGPEGVFVLPAGSPPSNPGGMVAGPAMHELLAQLREDYDYAVIDAPSLAAVTDAAALARRADGAIVVTRSGRTTRQQVAAAAESLATAHARLLGVVLNRVAAPRPWARKAASEYYSGSEVVSTGR